MALIEFIIVFILGYVIGHRISTFFHVAAFRKILEELGVTHDQMLKLGLRVAQELGRDPRELGPDAARSTVVEVKLEQHGSEIYAFRKDNDQFLGQGADRDTLIARLNQTMRPCIVNISKEDGADLIKKVDRS